MAWEENSCICLHMQLIAILSRIGVEYCWKIDSYSEWQFVRVAPPFTVFHNEIKWSKRLTQQYNHLILNTPCSSSTRTNTNSYELAARQLKAQKYKRYRDFVKKFLYRFLGLCRFWVIRIWRFCRQVIIKYSVNSNVIVWKWRS